MATNPLVQKPYQTNQSTNPQTAAASSVGKPPVNAFMQGLNGAWKGVTNFANSINPFNPANNTANPNAAQPTSSRGLPAGGKSIPLVKTATNVANAAKNAYNSVQIDPNMNVSLNGNKPVNQPVPTKQVAKETIKTTPPAQTAGYQSTTPTIPTYTAPAPTSPTNNGGTDAQGSVISNLANITNPTTYQQVVNNLANFKNPRYEQAIENVKKLQNQQAEAIGGLGMTPMTSGSLSGRAGTLKTGYQNAIGNEAALASAALTGGAQQLSGLQSAQGAMQRTLGQYGQTMYDPMTGLPVSAFGGTQGGAGVSTSDPFYATLQSYAQMAANGQYSAIPSSITGNSVLNAQMNQMAKQINPNYNPVTSQAQSGIIASQAGNVATMTAAYKSATNLGSQLKDLITTFGINPADINSVNSGIQKVAQNVSSPQYKALYNLVTDIVSTYATILTPGSTSNQAQDKAASLLDASAKGTSIMATLQNLDEQAKAKIAGQTTGYGENPGGTNSSSSGNSWNDIFG